MREPFKTHIDIINFQDNETNYLYSDVINKRWKNCKDIVEKTKREILDTYTGTLNRFFRISSIILDEIIPDDILKNKENSSILISKMFTGVLRANWMHMIYCLKKEETLFLDAESDYFLEFDGLAKYYKKKQRAFKGKEFFNTKQYFKDLHDSIIGYITVDDMVQYFRNREKYENNEDRSKPIDIQGLSHFFRFIPGVEEELNATSFVFLDKAVDAQTKYDLLNNHSNLYRNLSLIFENMWGRIRELREEHVLNRDKIEKEGYNKFSSNNGINDEEIPKEKVIDLINFNILLFSSLYNVIDYFLYRINAYSNRAFEQSKMLQLQLREEKKGKSDMMDYDDNKLNGAMTKEEFEKIMGKSVEELENERQDSEEGGEDEGYDEF